MGKIRVRTLGDETLEKDQQKEAKKRKEEKKLTKAPGLKGGERVSAVGPTEEELAKAENTEKLIAKEAQPEKKEKKSKNKKVTAKKKTRSQKYQLVAKLVEHNKLYPLQEALTLLPKLKISSFDETVELHINTTEPGISGSFSLPHGTGKKTRVLIADPTIDAGTVDALVKKIESGVIDFDILIATPSAMPKLARIARILGPKGLMPNPKNGTVSDKPTEAAKKFEAGQIRYKTEAKLPVLHLSVGKLSFGDKKLTENIKTVMQTVQTAKMKKVTLKSTMSPAIRIDLAHI